MTHRIVGEWDLAEVSKAARGKGSPLGRIVFLEQDGQVVVRYADAGGSERPSRVDVDGEMIRFEILSGRSARGNTNYVYEVSMQGRDAFGGTRRQGLLSRTPITGQRVEAPVAAPSAPAAPAAMPSYATGDLSTSLIAMPGSVAEAKARAAEAAERAALAAAEAAAMQAEAEAAAALEAARRAAENAAAARTAIHTQSPVPEQVPAAPQPPFGAPVPNGYAPPSVLANLPAPTQPAQPWPLVPPVAPAEYAPAPAEYAPPVIEAMPAAAPAPVYAPTLEDTVGVPTRRQVRITHRLSREGRSNLAAEVFPGVFVWGDALVTTEFRLRQFGWELTPIATDATIDVDDALIEHAAMVRDSFGG